MKNTGYLIFIFVIYIDLFSGVKSKSVSINIFQEIGKGSSPAACKTVQFLLNSTFTQSCALETFPVMKTPLEDSKNQTILCLALYDYSLKWCSRSSQNIPLPEIANATVFDTEVAKFASVDSIGNFCESDKSSYNETIASELKNFYKHSSKCTLYCTDFSKGINQPKKICSALFWLDHTLKTYNPGTPISPTPEKKSKVGDKTAENSVSVVKNTEEEITKSKTPEGRTPVVEKQEENAHEAKKPESGKLPSTISNNKTTSTENLQLGQPNTGANSEKVKISISNNDNQVKKVVGKVDSSSGSGNVDTQKVAPATTKKELPSVENTDVKLPPEDVSTTGKKLDSTDKSSTISENTVDGPNEKTGGIQDIPPPFPDIEEDSADDDGQKEESPAQKKVQNYPSRTIEEESHFFSYLVVISLLFVCFYFAYHNKKKVLAMFLEGRRSRNGRGRRRPSTANYRKLDCNLEEAVTSQCNSNVTHVIY
ncbi:trans-Golgi network integral membrane protein 1-like [Belonocnema kinseyi]|uniref:trans-Golgi network integral membrane protein 1-like n=1 Tax=Belonocnema kinseyi TaxID=2817044 RepID=UPI00143DF232|nr:trans-Golgi network integral membrane protein 1-like [Belonocnema kinseyi]